MFMGYSPNKNDTRNGSSQQYILKMEDDEDEGTIWQISSYSEK